MAIKSAQIGQWSDKELYGRFPGPDATSTDPYESTAVERANALAWALKHPVPESADMVIARAEIYRRYFIGALSEAR